MLGRNSSPLPSVLNIKVSYLGGPEEYIVISYEFELIF